MSLVRRLSELRPSRAPVLPALHALASASERVLARWPDVVPRTSPADREELVMEMKERQEADRWDGAFVSLVTAAARALFDAERRDRPDLAGLRGFYLAEIEATSRSSILNAMMAVYLESYSPGAPHTRALAFALQRASGRLGGRWRRLLDTVPAIFDPVGAPQAVARLMHPMTAPWTDLKAIGIRSPHAPGLMDHAHLDYVARLAPDMRLRWAQERLFAWLKPEGQTARASGASEAISAVLAPWKNITPPDEDVRYLSRALIDRYRDPRVETGGAWARVSSDLKQIIVRWLTKASIHFFIDVISSTAPATKRRMFEDRRAFWLKRYDEKRVKTAWVAFSSKAALYAESKMSSVDDADRIGYGLQTAKSHPETSLLILHIDDQIIVEGSHDFRVYGFLPENRNAPPSVGPEYNCKEIMESAADWTESHRGRWQDRVLNQLRL